MRCSLQVQAALRKSDLEEQCNNMLRKQLAGSEHETLLQAIDMAEQSRQSDTGDAAKLEIDLSAVRARAPDAQSSLEEDEPRLVQTEAAIADAKRLTTEITQLVQDRLSVVQKNHTSLVEARIALERQLRESVHRKQEVQRSAHSQSPYC